MSSSPSEPSSLFAEELAEQRSVNLSSRAEAASFAGHRARMTELVCAEAPSSAARLCVLGAGNCNDLELARVCERYAEVHLVDIDGDALASAFDRLGPADRAKVRCHAPIELSGVLAALPRWKTFDVNARELMARPEVAASAIARSLPGPFEVVVSACVLTQLQLSVLRALGDRHRLFEAARYIVNLTHLRTLSALLAPGGAALFVTDAASDRIVPRRELEEARDLVALLRELGARGALFHAVNPALIALTCGDDPELRRTLSVAEPRKAWLWQNGPERTLLTYALLLRRVQVGAQG